MKAEELNKRTKQSVVWFTLLPFTMHFCRFANSIILARILTPSDFAVVAIITILLYYSNSLTDFGLSNALVQRKELTRKHYGVVFAFNLTISMIFFLLFYFNAHTIAIYFQMPVLEPALQVYSAIFIVSAFLAVPRANLRRNVRFKALAIIDAIKVVLSIVCSLGLAQSGYGVWSIVIAMLVSQLALTLMTMFKSEVSLSISFCIRSFRDLLSFSVWSFIEVQVNMLSQHLDKLIVGKSIGADELGFYDKANGLAKMPNEQLAQKLFSISFSTLSRTTSDVKEFSYYVEKFVVLSATICLPVFIGLYLVADVFTLSLLGEKWAPMIETFQLMALSYLFMSLNGPYMAAMNSIGKIGLQVKLKVVFVFIFVSCLFLLDNTTITDFAVLFLGLQIAMLVSLILQNYYVLKIKLNTLLFGYIPSMIAVTFMIVLMQLYRYSFPVQSTMYDLIILILIGAVSYAGCFMCLPSKRTKFLRNKVTRAIKGVTS